MKLMGAPKLFALAAGASLAARGACAALCAELEDGKWTCAAEVAESFPRAGWRNSRIVIAVDDALYAVIAFNFERGIALIEADQSAAMSMPTASTGRRRPS